MIIKILLGVLIGSVFGAVMGYFGQCTSGACPLTANPYRGAIYGGVLGVIFIVMVTSSKAASLKKDYQDDSKEENKMVVNIGSNEAFEKLMGLKGVVLVDFYADWCHPCKLLSPVIDKLAEQYKDRVIVCKADVMQLSDLAQRFMVTGTPTVVVFKDNQEFGRMVGLHKQPDYSRLLDKALKEEASE